MKIFAVYKNYSDNKEMSLKASLRKNPTIYLKPDSALLKDHKPFFIPDNLGNIQFCAELVVRICRLGKSIPQRFAHRYYDAATVGVNFIATDLLRKLSEEGLPWEEATSFDGSAVLGDWIETEKFRDMQAIHFSLKVNTETVQESLSSDMFYTIDKLISLISMNFTMKTGDILYTGCPVEWMPVHINDQITGFLEDRKVLEFNLK